MLAFAVITLLRLRHINVGGGDCTGRLGAMMVAATLVWGILATCVSMLNRVGAGLLPPSVAFAYSALLCW